MKMRKAIKAKSFSLLLTIVLFFVAVAVTLAFVLLHINKKAHKGERGFQSRLGNFSRAAVATDARECAKVGKDILEGNGSAVDSAIATLLCMGVVIPHSTGIGGGVIMTIYRKESGRVEILDARETAPKMADENMYNANPDKKTRGGLSVAVPGELRGFQEAHEKYGIMNWSDLFQPAIKLAKDGFPVGAHLESAILQAQRHLNTTPTLESLLTNPDRKDNKDLYSRLYKRRETMKNANLARTLEEIAEAGNANPFYEGAIAQKIVDDVQKDGGILSLDDLRSYRPRWLTPLSVPLMANLTLYSPPPPGSGVVLSLILNIMGLYDYSFELFHNQLELAYHRLVESYKFAFAQRTRLEDVQDAEMDKLLQKMTSLDFAKDIVSRIKDSETSHDPDFYGAAGSYSEDHGTSHVSVIAPNGDAVAASSTINLYFGSGLVSSTGVILNDEMDDFNSPNITNAFGVPPSDKNLIVPGRRPMSSMAPAIILDGDHVRMTVGGSGGTHITTGIASVIWRTMWLKQNVKSAIDAARLHDQLYPNSTIYERLFPEGIRESLSSKGHIMKELTGRGAVIEAVVRGDDNRLYANADYRKEGEIDGF